MVIKVIESKEQFKAELKNAAEKAVLVDFFATWCGPCKVIAPYLEQLASEYSTVVVLKLDVEEVEDVAMDEGITAMPTFKVYKNSVQVDELLGSSKEKLKALFETYK